MIPLTRARRSTRSSNALAQRSKHSSMLTTKLVRLLRNLQTETLPCQRLNSLERTSTPTMVTESLLLLFVQMNTLQKLRAMDKTVTLTPWSTVSTSSNLEVLGAAAAQLVGCKMPRRWNSHITCKPAGACQPIGAHARKRGAPRPQTSNCALHRL